jgi:outer membrane protein, multidrug efflux system
MHIKKSSLHLNLFHAAILLIVCACTFKPKNDKQKEVYGKYKDYKWSIDTIPGAKKSSNTSLEKKGNAGNSQTNPQDWWTVFHDHVLDSLEEIALKANFDIKTSIARVNESHSLVRLAVSYLYPAVVLQPLGTRTELSANRPNPFSATGAPLQRVAINTFQFPLNLNYEIDLWGKYRNGIENAKANYLATEEDMKALRLSVAGEVATNYFILRTADLQIDLLEKAIQTRIQNLQLTQERYRVGLIILLDVTQAETDLQTLQSQLFDAKRSRQETEHSIALLCGEAAFRFAIPARNWMLLPPEIPIGIPSDLIKRRPDIVEQELLMQAANANIGVYAANRFPSFILTGSAGTLSQRTRNLLTPQSRTWTIGMGISMPIFQGGRISSTIQAAKAHYEQTSSVYEQQILTAFKEVEDALSNLIQRKEQAAIQEQIVQTSIQSALLSRERYNKGLITYFEVLNNERTALNSQSISSQILGQRLIYTISLIKALGGGWGKTPEESK